MEVNKIYCQDCEEGMRLLSDKSVDLVITSPPYADLKKYENFSGVHPDKYVEWFFPKILEISRVMKDTGSFILNINDKIGEDGFRHPYVFNLVSKITTDTNLKLYERLFWNKGKYIPSSKRFGDRVEYLFWFVKTNEFTFNMDEMRVPYDPKSIKRMKYKIKDRHPRTQENQKDGKYKEWIQNPLGALPSTLVSIGSESKKISEHHIAVYPEKLVDYFMRGSSNIGDLVLDPFMGSGTTAVVAKKLKRNWIGFDNSQLYITEAEKRISL